jgi:DNA primase
MPIVKYQDRYPIKKTNPSYQGHPSPSFEKKHFLYGLHFAKTSIAEKQTAIVVEGWTDVIMLHKAGVTHAVGTMGVMLSTHQLDQLKKCGAKKIIIMRDGDAAGEKTIHRDAKIIEQHDLIPYVYFLSQGIDPCDFAKKAIESSISLTSHIEEESKPYHQYVLHRMYTHYHDQLSRIHMQSFRLKSNVLKDLETFLSCLKKDSERSFYAREISTLFDFSPSLFSTYESEESLCLTTKTEENIPSFLPKKKACTDPSFVIT